MPINIGPGGRFYATGGAKTLPRNFLINPGTQLEDFESTDGWTVSAGATLEVNESEYSSGTKSLRLTTANGTESYAYKTVAWNLDYDWQQARLWTYQHSPMADYDQWLTAYSRLWTVPGSSSYNFFWTKGAGPFVNGIQECAYTKNYFRTVTGSPAWDNITQFRIVVKPGSGKTVSASFDNFRVGVKAHPCILLRFDDGASTQYTQGFCYMRRYGMRGTLVLSGKNVDAGATYPTHAQLQEMHSAGWTIGNHTQNHPDLTTLSVADQQAEIMACDATLTSWGINRGLYVAYPSDSQNDDTVTAMGNIGARLGWGGWIHGYVSGSTIYTPMILPYPATNPYSYLGGIGTNGVSLATCKTYVDNAITSGTILNLTFHGIGGEGLPWPIDDFRALIDYIYAKRSYITPITIDDYYNASLGSVTVPELVAG